MKIAEIGGLEELGLDEAALDEDWDPDKHEVKRYVVVWRAPAHHTRK